MDARDGRGARRRPLPRRLPAAGSRHDDRLRSIRISVADSGGSALEQTIIRAYPLAVPPPDTGGGGGGKGGAAIRACTTAVVAPYAQCMALISPASGFGAPARTTGYGPADLASAYNLPAGAGAGKTVAIVDAYDDPNAEADLAAYRAAYGLPPCTAANGCFRKVNQHGAAEPAARRRTPGWGQEISLDLDAVSATCPSCKILLVEADTPSIFDLGTAVNTAVALGADADLEQLRQPRRVRGRARSFEPLLQASRRRDHRLARATTATATG